MATLNPLPAAQIVDPHPSERLRAAITRSTAAGATPEAAVDLELRLRRLEGLLAGNRNAETDSDRVQAIMASLPPSPPTRQRLRGLQAAAEAIARWLGGP